MPSAAFHALDIIIKVVWFDRRRIDGIGQLLLIELAKLFLDQLRGVNSFTWSVMSNDQDSLNFLHDAVLQIHFLSVKMQQMYIKRDAISMFTAYWQYLHSLHLIKSKLRKEIHKISD